MCIHRWTAFRGPTGSRRRGRGYCRSRVELVVNVPAPVVGSAMAPAVETVMMQPVASTAAEPLWNVHRPLELSTQEEPGTRLAVVALVRSNGSVQLGKSREPKAWNSTPPSVGTTVAVSGPLLLLPLFPNVSLMVVMPAQLPTSVGAPPSRLQAAPLLPPPELLLELVPVPVPEPPPELDPELPRQLQSHCQPPGSQTSLAMQGDRHEPQLFGPQLALLLPPLLPPDPRAQAHCQLPSTHWSFST